MTEETETQCTCPECKGKKGREYIFIKDMHIRDIENLILGCEEDKELAIKSIRWEVCSICKGSGVIPKNVLPYYIRGGIDPFKRRLLKLAHSKYKIMVMTFFNGVSKEKECLDKLCDSEH